MSYYGRGGYRPRGGGGHYPQSGGSRFGLAPLTRPTGSFRGRGNPNNYRGSHGPPRGPRPPVYRGGTRIPARGEVIRLGPSKPVQPLSVKKDESTGSTAKPNVVKTESKRDEVKGNPLLEKDVKNSNVIKEEDKQKDNKPKEDKTQEDKTIEKVVVKEEPKEDVQQSSAANVMLERVKMRLDKFNSELHIHFEDDDLTASIMRGPGFDYMWGGARATHGVTKGKVCFEVHLLENLKADLPDEKNPHVSRVGWSVDGSDYQLGEDKLSWGYGGTGKSGYESKFRDYGKRYGPGDVVTCYIDLDATPKAIFYMINGKYLGVAFRFTNELGTKAVYPHITCKNMKYKVNFGDQPPKYTLTNGFQMIQTLPAEDLLTPPAGPTKPEEAEVIMMVGLPACGKSFWCEKYAKQHQDKKYYVLGTNSIIDRMKVSGLVRKRNYHGRWEELIKRASGVLNKLFDVAKKRPRNYILDQTNVYFSARRRKMEAFRGYKRIAAVIVNKPEVLAMRSEQQKKLEGKIVPVEAVMEMKRNFTLPVVGPSFDDIMYIEEPESIAPELVEKYRTEGDVYKKNAIKRSFPSSSKEEPHKEEKKSRNSPHVMPNRGFQSASASLKPSLMDVDTVRSRGSNQFQKEQNESRRGPSRSTHEPSISNRNPARPFNEDDRSFERERDSHFSTDRSSSNSYRRPERRDFKDREEFTDREIRDHREMQPKHRDNMDRSTFFRDRPDKEQYHREDRDGNMYRNERRDQLPPFRDERREPMPRNDRDDFKGQGYRHQNEERIPNREGERSSFRDQDRYPPRASLENPRDQHKEEFSSFDRGSKEAQMNFRRDDGMFPPRDHMAEPPARDNFRDSSYSDHARQERPNFNEKSAATTVGPGMTDRNRPHQQQDRYQNTRNTEYPMDDPMGYRVEDTFPGRIPSHMRDIHDNDRTVRQENRRREPDIPYHQAPNWRDKPDLVDDIRHFEKPGLRNEQEGRRFDNRSFPERERDYAPRSARERDDFYHGETGIPKRDIDPFTRKSDYQNPSSGRQIQPQPIDTRDSYPRADYSRDYPTVAKQDLREPPVNRGYEELPIKRPYESTLQRDLDRQPQYPDRMDQNNTFVTPPVKREYPERPWNNPDVPTEPARRDLNFVPRYGGNRQEEVMKPNYESPGRAFHDERNVQAQPHQYLERRSEDDHFSDKRYEHPEASHQNTENQRALPVQGYQRADNMYYQQPADKPMSQQQISTGYEGSSNYDRGFSKPNQPESIRQQQYAQEDVYKGSNTHQSQVQSLYPSPRQETAHRDSYQTSEKPYNQTANQSNEAPYTYDDRPNYDQYPPTLPNQAAASTASNLAHLYTSSTANQPISRPNDRMASSYQTQMTTSTANYNGQGYNYTYQSSQQCSGDQQSTQVNNYVNEPSYQNSNYQNTGSYPSGNSYQSSSYQNAPPPSAAPPPPPPTQSAMAPGSTPQSYEQQQQDYQKAYSQWYANYAQAFAQLSQQKN